MIGYSGYRRRQFEPESAFFRHPKAKGQIIRDHVVPITHVLGTSPLVFVIAFSPCKPIFPQTLRAMREVFQVRISEAPERMEASPMALVKVVLVTKSFQCGMQMDMVHRARREWAACHGKN